MNQRIRKLLFDAERSIEAINEFVSGRTLADYLTNRMLRSSVERELITIGEVLGSIRRENADIGDVLQNSHKIVGLRNRIVHGYDEINDEAIWSIATEFVPALALELKALSSIITDEDS